MTHKRVDSQRVQDRFARFRRDHAKFFRMVEPREIFQLWPKFWARFILLIGIFSQNVGPTCIIWANPVNFALMSARSAPQSLPVQHKEPLQISLGPQPNGI